jgi:hypothetical protein
VRLRNLVVIAGRVQARLDLLSAGPAPAESTQPGLAKLAADANTGSKSVDAPYAAESSQPGLAKLAADAHATAETVAALCAGRGGSTADLAAPSRRAYQWLKFLGDSANTAAVADALALARHVLAHARWPRRPAVADCLVTIEFYPHAFLYRMRAVARQAGAPLRITLAPGYIYAPPEVFDGLLRAVLGYGRSARLRLHAYALSDDFAETTQSLELATEPPPGGLHSAHHDLEQVFARVNAAYFAGRLPRPRLAWSSTIARRLLGYYQSSTDRLMISRILDHPRVPAAAIDLVMYHELLHKHLGVQVIDGRHYAHTEAFRQAERQFRGFEAAQAFLKHLPAAPDT